jgi:hypothetical protein
MDSQQVGETPGETRTGKGSLVTTVVLVLLLIAAIGFGGWAYSKMLDYKNNSDQKAAAAVASSKKQITDQLQAQFDQQSKQPYKTFTGSPTFGSITFNYPKSWSAYVDSTDSNEPINGYFHPDVVPGVNSKTAYALRVELVSDDYSQVLQNFQSSASQGGLTAKAYVPPKMQGAANVTAGTYLSGQINPQDQTQIGNMVIIKVRDKTLEIYSESAAFADDFNNTVLSSLTFVP